jgi:HipA-like kinase
MKIQATRFVRKMRGAAQAHLLECDDGHFYVVKFRNNPKDPRILINEWIGSSLLAYLRIPTPEIAAVNVSAEFLARTPDIHIQFHATHLAVEAGLHFGSRYPGASETTVYDFVPDLLLERVANLNEFLGVLVLDKWIGNADARQAIFVRSGTQRLSISGSTLPRQILASMIDQGDAFGGQMWSFFDSPLQGLYHNPGVYRDVRSLDDFQPWLDQVVDFPEEVLYNARRRIPPEWILGNDASLDRLLGKLLLRRERVPDMIESSSSLRMNPFPKWKERSAVASDQVS